jgi:putative ABC transport system substrate-binding protein
MVAVGDPVGTGLVASLARPGGNQTGLTSLAPELEGKRLELLSEIMPNVSRLAVLWNPENAYMVESEKQVAAAADALHLKLSSFAVRNLQELEAAFSALAAQLPDALNVLADRLFLHERVRIIEFSARFRLPGVHAYRELVEAGGLMSYGPSYADR